MGIDDNETLGSRKRVEKQCGEVGLTRFVNWCISESGYPIDDSEIQFSTDPNGDHNLVDFIYKFKGRQNTYLIIRVLELSGEKVCIHKDVFCSGMSEMQKSPNLHKIGKWTDVVEEHLERYGQIDKHLRDVSSQFKFED